MSLLDRLLPEPDFVVRDPEAVTQELVAQYELLTDKTLYPAQVERILIDVLAYRESLMREAIQDAAKLNLVRYSRYPILDYLGENVGVTRLAESAAVTTMRFVFAVAPSAATLLPAGTVINAGDVGFATIDNVTVPAGALSIDVSARCLQTGTIGNGFLLGQISELASSLSGLNVASVSNIDTSADGSEAEDDDNYKERIVLAPEQFSNAGSDGAYKFFARSAHPDIIDVAIVTAEMVLTNGVLTSTNGIPPGVVKIYPLMKNGLPSANVKALVYAACTPDNVRPVTDFVQVLDPEVFDYSIVAPLTLYKNSDSALALQLANQAAIEYRDTQRQSLGKDIVRDQIISKLKVYGVYSVNLSMPAIDKVLTKYQWARCTSINITIPTLAEG